MNAHAKALPTAQQNADLHAFIARRADRPFAWGTSDCAVFAFDAVHAATGLDRVSDLRGTYFSARGALRVLNRFAGLPGLADQRMTRRLAASEARDGDLALLTTAVCDASEGRTGALGVAWHGHIVAQGETGLVVVPIDSALIWWGVR